MSWLSLKTISNLLANTVMTILCVILILASLIFLIEWWNVGVKGFDEGYGWGRADDPWYFASSQTYSLVNFALGAVMLSMTVMGIIRYRQARNSMFWLGTSLVLLVMATLELI